MSIYRPEEPSDTEYEKPTVSTDALDTLGSVITPEEGRDAIHLAVEPVEAAQKFAPGEHVKLNDDGRAIRALTGKGLGIVDPFLTDVVEPGQWFWLVVYPRQIDSLRHVWEHPAFPPSGDAEKHNRTRSAAEAELWIRKWMTSEDMYGDDYYEDFMSSVATHKGGEVLDFDRGGYDKNIPDEFWPHAEKVLGRKLTPARRFGCCA